MHLLIQIFVLLKHYINNFLAIVEVKPNTKKSIIQLFDFIV